MSGRDKPADAEIGKPLGFVVGTWHIYAKMTDTSSSAAMDCFIILASVCILLGRGLGLLEDGWREQGVQDS